MESAILIGSIAVNVVLTAIILLFIFKLKNIEKHYSEFISKFNSDGNIENTFKEIEKMVNNVNEENKIIKSNYKSLEKQLNECFQNIGIVKYDAFDDVGSKLSFAIALLDNKDNGFIINSVYGRSSSNVYAKRIENGNSLQTLSEEEISALNKAKELKKI